MVTYPSTYGVFEEDIREICDIVHEHGGQVYMDGANMNAQVGLTSPAAIGADVCHLNLHKTFAIPHGGGGPGMGPIAVAKHLAPYLPGHPVVKVGGDRAIPAVAAAPWGSASILLISYGYIRMLGVAGHDGRDAFRDPERQLHQGPAPESLRRAVREPQRPRRARDDLRSPPVQARVRTVDRRAGRRQAADGLRVSRADGVIPRSRNDDDRADRERVEAGARSVLRRADCDSEGDSGGHRRHARIATDNVLKNAPHTADAVSADDWSHPYSREQAAYPLPFVRANKFWPAVARIDNPYGDRNLICACPPMEEYVEQGASV